MINVTTAQDLLSELPDGLEVVPLPIVRQIINERLGPWHRNQQAYAVRDGAIRPLPGRVGQVHALAVSRDEAVLILVAALLAFAAGVAVVGMIRALRVSGVDPGAFVKTT